MTPVADLETLRATIEAQPGVLVLYGGATCGVCTVIKPKLEALITERFPKLETLYVDCDASPDLAAQEGIHTRPVVRVYFDGQRFVEHARAFGIEQVAGDIDRPYALMFE